MFFPSLTKSPIVKMIVEARFDKDDFLPALFTDELTDRFRILETDQSSVLASDATSEIEADGNRLSYRLISGPYPDWHQTLAPAIEEVLIKYAKCCKSEVVEQLTLTFYNKMKIEEHPSLLADYFNFITPPVIAKKFQSLNPRAGSKLTLPTMERFIATMDFTQESIPAYFSCQLSGEHARGCDYQLTNMGRWDAVYDGTPVRAASAVLRLSQLKDHLYLIFNAITTDKCRELFDRDED